MGPFRVVAEGACVLFRSVIHRRFFMPLSLGLRPGRIVVLSTLLGLMAWACGDSDKEKIQAVGLSQGCTLNSECSDPLVCTFARCHQQCMKDRDCQGE